MGLVSAVDDCISFTFVNRLIVTRVIRCCSFGI
jgi:hypothetical protein